jgi:hypothetical protein
MLEPQGSGTCSDADLRAELLAMFTEDQEAMRVFLAEAGSHRDQFERTQVVTSGTPWPYALLEWAPPQEAPVLVRRVVTAVRGNTARLREIVSAHGWPGRSLVGGDGATAAWLLLQHTNSRVTTIRSADGDEFCRSCVTLLRDAVARGEAHPRHLAAVADSLRLANSEPPEFASLTEQYPVDRDGQAAARQDVDLPAIDRRRAAIGLRPLAADIARYREGGGVNEIDPDQWEPWPARPSGQA